MKFPKEALVDYIFDGSDCEEHGLKFVEMGLWIDDGKYSHREYIFEHDGKFYSILNFRSGSYFSDYEYDHQDWDDEVNCNEVERVTITKHEWRSLSKQGK